MIQPHGFRNRFAPGFGAPEMMPEMPVGGIPNLDTSWMTEEERAAYHRSIQPQLAEESAFYGLTAAGVKTEEAIRQSKLAGYEAELKNLRTAAIDTQTATGGGSFLQTLIKRADASESNYGVDAGGVRVAGYRVSFVMLAAIAAVFYFVFLRKGSPGRAAARRSTTYFKRT